MVYTSREGAITTGKLYGISVGPGEPGLLTIKAKEILDKCDIIAYPVKTAGEGSVALNIIKPNVDLSKKEVREYVFSMNPDYAVREQGWKKAYDDIAAAMDEALAHPEEYGRKAGEYVRSETGATDKIYNALFNN